MVWILGISVIFNILLLIVIVFLTVAFYEHKHLSVFYHEQWDIWEQRWYTAQSLVSDEYDQHLSIDGIHSEMKIKPYARNKTEIK